MAAKKKPAAKEPRAAATRVAKKKKPAPKKKKAIDTITVGITPPWLAEGSMAADVYKLFGSKSTRPTPAELSVFPWFRQDEAYQIGYYLLTHGLREQCNHPEIEICNVPGVFVGAANQLLNTIADYVLDGGKLKDGESMEMTSDLLKVVAFREIKPGTHGTDHDRPVLRVLFLC
jgi:hypothetical protein